MHLIKSVSGGGGRVSAVSLFTLAVISVQLCVPYVSSSSGGGGGVALIESEAYEQTCIDLNVDDVSLDYLWVMEHSEWYFPMMSRLDLYRTSMDLLRKPVSELTEDHVMSSACTKVTWEGFSPKISGFGGKSLEYELNSQEDNTFTFSGDWRKGAAGQMYLTKTDNQEYIVFVKCWEDGQMSWQVMSTKKNLAAEVKDEILQHLKTLGLAKLQYFVVHQHYNNCSPIKHEL